MASLVLQLVRPVMKALASTGVTQKELLGGAIEFTDLMWQAPPLVCDAKVDGVPLSQYMDTHAPRVRVNDLYEFWDRALINLRLAPYKVAEDTGWRTLSYSLPDAKAGMRAYWITMPEGFPREISDYEGVTLSLECAHLLRCTGNYVDFVESPDDYYVVLHDGRKVGVEGGLPILHGDQWDIPVTGMVPDLLRLSRGASFVGCDYDLIAKIRSLLHSNREGIAEFEGLDLALQTLRLLSAGKQLSEVQNAVRSLDNTTRKVNHRLQVIREAIEVAELFRISDRTRVLAIKSLLVPEVMTAGRFRNFVYSDDKGVPAALSPRVLLKIRNRLQQLLDEELSNAG